MLEKLHLKNVGPAPELEIEFAPRLNIITGDNGLGKSFILDVAWWVLTQNWITEVNPQIQNSKRKDSVTASISSSVIPIGLDIGLGERSLTNHCEYIPKLQQWKPAKILESYSMVLYYRSDGTFAVRDNARDEGLKGVPVFKFSATHVWNGFEENGKVISNGLIRDVAKWQLEKGVALEQFKAALQTLSPNQQETLELGELTSVSISDARDIPTLKMPYGQEIPVTQASSAIRRILAFAYMIVWTWQEHLRISKLKDFDEIKEIIVLVDELEQHLHPQWQRVVLESILSVVKAVSKEKIEVQIIATTHSPLVMASLEPLFDPKQDAWFDFNLVKGEVTLEKMAWYKRGDAEKWLISDAFDLGNMGTGSVPREKAMLKAAALFREPKVSKKKFLEIDRELRSVLGEMDDFWIRWRFLGEKKGWL